MNSWNHGDQFSFAIAEVEEMHLGANPVTRLPEHLDEGDAAAAAVAKLATAIEAVEGDLSARIATLEMQVLRYETAFEGMPTGVCFFDGEERLIRSNRRFAEICRLASEQVRPGATLRELEELGIVAGTFAMSEDEHLDATSSIDLAATSRSWITKLKEERTIKVRRQPMPGGGWVATYEDITELNAARAAANERLSLQALIDRLPDNLWVKDVNSRFVIANQVTAKRIGVAGPADLIGKTDLELLPMSIAEKFFNDEQSIVRSGQPMIDMEEYMFDDAGGKIWILTTKVPLRNDQNDIFAVAGISRDITDRKRADALRDGQAQILQMIVTSAPLENVLDRLMRLVESQLKGIFSSVLLLDDRAGRLWHSAAPTLPQAYAKAIDGMPVGPNVGSCGTAAYRREAVFVADIMTDPLWADYKDLAAAHGLRSCWSTPIQSHNGAVLGTFAMYSTTAREPIEAETRLIDVATRIAGIAIERKLAEDRIHFMANHDALTGLPNRALLNDRLPLALLYARRYDRWVTVLNIDLDNFKIVNDSLGHNAGDELLKAIARRMVDCIRATDTVVRLGGDEFVVILLDQPKSAEIISAAVEKLRAVIAQTVQLGGHDLRVTSSIGIAIYPSDGTNAEALLAHADAAMYRAKENGRDNFQFYTPELNYKVHEKFLLQKELRNAVARSEFMLFYQPQVEARTGRVFAFEALIRWMHPTLGMVPPIKFIPMAEEMGLIVPIGNWVMREACRQNKAWQDAGLPHLNICVNVSARQFTGRSLVSHVIGALKETGMDAKYLELEMTESLIMTDVELTIATMKELQALGVQISIDDFGTGHSSLSALKTFPVARLKIDKSFVDGLPGNESDKTVISAMISLGQKLNLRVLAEGIETEAQAAFLRENKCDEMQGYLFSRPVPADQVETLLSVISH